MIGFSLFIQNVVFAVLFYFGTLILDWKGGDPEDIWISIFIIFMGAMGAGSAAQFGPQVGKAAKSAVRIFSIIDAPSEIDVSKKNEYCVKIDPSTFKGLIEF